MLRLMANAPIARSRWLLLIPLLLSSACDQSSSPTPPASAAKQPAPAQTISSAAPAAGEWHEFQGTWTTSGTRRALNLGPDQRAAIFELTGSLLLSGAQRPAVGFQSRAIGFSDTRTGMQGRCVWTDERGDAIFSELKGEFIGTGNRITGTFLGGTGRWTGITGEYTFQWQYVVDAAAADADDGAVSGRVVDLKGRARLTPASAPAPTTAPKTTASTASAEGEGGTR
jgi:hypothetical protein